MDKNWDGVKKLSFFSRSRIKLSLYVVKIFWGDFFERGAFDEVLPVEPDGVVGLARFRRCCR